MSPEVQHNLTVPEAAIYELASMFEDMSVYEMTPAVEDFAAMVTARRDQLRERETRRLEAGLE